MEIRIIGTSPKVGKKNHRNIHMKGGWNYFFLKKNTHTQDGHQNNKNINFDTGAETSF
jgi:hypothetical protein